MSRGGRWLAAAAVAWGCGAAARAAEDAGTMELTMELHTRWNEVMVFRVPVEAGQPFRAEGASGSARHVVCGTVGAPEHGAYLVSLRFSRWANDRLTSLHTVTMQVTPPSRWLGTTGLFSGDQLLAVTLAPAGRKREKGEHGWMAQAD